MRTTLDIRAFFCSMKDPRLERARLHSLEDIVFITIAAVISGAESWNDIEDFGKSKREWLSTFLELPNGIPSHDTFNRFFSALDPESFEECFMNWISSISEYIQGEVISIDGKALRGSKWNASQTAIHLVSAWANTNQLALAQCMVDQKSNEITAIPKLLDMLFLKGCIITIDAMGTQCDIAKKIVEKEADYILAVKGNQKELFENIQDAFRFEKKSDSYKTVESDHGRVETRICTIITTLEMIENPDKWSRLQTLIRLDCERYSKATKKTETETRFYISSLNQSAEKIGSAIRSHWGIENKLHWMLDVAFNEDHSRKRAGNAAVNFSTLNKIALNLLKKEGTLKRGIKGKRLKAAWDLDYLLKILEI